MSLRKPFITLYAATVLALFSSPLTAADAYLYSEHGDWETRIEVDDHQNMQCSSLTHNSQDEAFEIVMHSDGYVSLYFWFDNLDRRFGNQPSRVNIIGVGAWTLEEVHMAPYGGMFTFDSPLQGLEFIVDVQKGLWVETRRAADHPDSGRFSLKGSKAAIDDLFECARRTTGIGA